MAQDDLIRSIPVELRAKYLESSNKMTPGALRLRFGVDRITDEGRGPRTPRTEIGKAADRLATQALRAWQDIHQAHWSSVADPTADKRAAFLRSAQFAKGRLKQITAEHDAILAAIEDKAKHLSTVLGNARKPPASYGDALIDAEVRAMIRAETNPAKAAEIARSHPRAVATLPEGIGARLVGESTYRTLVREHLQQAEPDNLADNDDLRESLAQLSQAHDTLTKEANGLIDFEVADKMEKQGSWMPPAQEAA